MAEAGAHDQPLTFVVVGHVNRGKSSIVSTLAADDSVRIDAAPGTTRHNRRFPMRLGDRTLYVLVDTPGFERARQVLAWLKAHETSTAERRGTVERFLREHRGQDAFEQEQRLLEPILAGGAVLYVVDGSAPPTPAAEAEMQILRWTAQPRIALINRTARRDFSKQWRPVLDQYFSIVRDFDAHAADFERRVGLLRTLAELDERWRDRLEGAIEALRADRAQRRREAAGRISDALVDVLTAVQEKKLPARSDVEPHKADLAQTFYEQLRQRERKLRDELRGVYLHHVLRIELVGGEDQPLDEDLFDTGTWSKLGLSRGQLAAGGAAGGALAGGAVDLAAGGASFLLGSIMGAGVGAVSGWWGFGKLAETKVLGRPMGGRLLRVGPVRSPQFPWVVLDRAALYHRLVADHAHAKRDVVRVELDAAATGVVRDQPAERRKQLQAQFDRLRKLPGPAERDAIRIELTPLVEQVLTR